MAATLRGGYRLAKRSVSVGFALPTILIASVVMLIVLLVSVTSTTGVRTALKNQYYEQLAQVAGEAGIAYAQACLAANNGVPQWTDAKPLTPSTDCSGNPLSTPTANVLVVAGGGGGGSDMGGGGGGGGVLTDPAYTLAATTYNITVGGGGAGAPAGIGQVRGTNGGNSVFGTMTAIGGGGGGSEYSNNTSVPGVGGSGGGTAGCNQTTAAAGTAGQGYAGGSGGPCYYPGGGGGAGGPGVFRPGTGGPGVLNTILGTPYYWGGGGGGSGYSGIGGDGGIGGGGGGAVGSTAGGAGYNSGSPGGGGTTVAQTNTPGGNAGANTGGGGGGGSHYNSNNKGGNGGSGVVIISYPTGSVNVSTTGTVQTTTVGTNTVQIFKSTGTFVVNSISGFTCPTDPKCSITSNGTVRSGFSIGSSVLGTNGTAKAFVVAGGGSGGGSTGGGGGGGGVVYNAATQLTAGSYPVIVGAGGAIPGNQQPGRDGSNSSFNNITAVGGGGGGYSAGGTSGAGGRAGGSGGGGQNYYSSFASGSGVSGQGNAGGPLGTTAASGGGGAGGVGSAGVGAQIGGNGGIGIPNPMTGIYYGGGGGGGNGGIGGNGGGSNGVQLAATSATPNTGGGGGGGYNYTGGNGGAGGSGIVIVSYPTGSMVATGGTVTTSGSDTYHVFYASDTFVVTSVDNRAKTIPNTGYVEILRQSNGAVWRRYEQKAVPTAVVPDQCSGDTKSIYGWNNAVINTATTFTPEPLAKYISISGNAINPGELYFRKDFSVTKPGTYVLNNAGDDMSAVWIDGRIVGTLKTGTQTNNVTLTAGCHTIYMKVVNEGVLPSYGSGALSLKKSDASVPLVVSDATWRVSVGNTEHFSEANYYASPSGWSRAVDVRASIATDANWTSQTGDTYARFISSPTNLVAGSSPAAQWTNFRDSRTVTVAANTQVKVGVQCDDNCIVYLDGQVIIASAAWSADYTTTITLTPGAHQFGVSLYNASAGQAGFSFVARDPVSGTLYGKSDASWLAANYWNTTDQNPSSYDHTFTTNPKSITTVPVQLLVVGGGGSGGTSAASQGGGGGGGGGGLINTSYTVEQGMSYSVTVGAGGAAVAATTTRGNNGANSTFGELTAFGGGGGGSINAISDGLVGGSGGGGGYKAYALQVGAIGILGQGNKGGDVLTNNNGGGGGGAGGVGGNTNNTGGAAGGNGGLGGAGFSSSISGSPVTYAVGGQGGTPPSGFANGTANRGNGGSGVYAAGGSGAGGSGIVIISYPSTFMTATGGAITSSGGNTIHTFTSNGTFTITSIP